MMPVAPNPTRVRLYVAEKREGGADMALTEVRVNLVKGEQNAPEHLARNPFGRSPVLGLDDGSYLTESLAIIEYLEERYPEPDLLGGTDSQMIANVIERQFKSANDWPFGAALSFILMYVTFFAIAIRSYWSGREADGTTP